MVVQFNQIWMLYYANLKKSRTQLLKVITSKQNELEASAKNQMKDLENIFPTVINKSIFAICVDHHHHYESPGITNY